MTLPVKYLKPDLIQVNPGLYANPMSICSPSGPRFHEGSGFICAEFLREMSVRHPIMYLLFYRWWIPMQLSPEEREEFDRVREVNRYKYTAYWMEFALYHPVQFVLLRPIWIAFQPCVKLFAAPIEVVKRMFRRVRVPEEVPVNDELTEQGGGVPS